MRLLLELIRSRALLPTGIADDVVVEHDGGRITAVRRPEQTDPPALPGLLVPGLVNAHLHLELAGVAVPGGRGLPLWVRGVMAAVRDPSARRPAAEAIRASGTALVCDVSNAGDTAPTLAAAGLAGVVQHELLGFGAARVAAGIATAAEPDRVVDGIVVRPSPHATYSTAPELVRAACRPGRAPATIHLAEDPGEAAFTQGGLGPFADLLDSLGVDWRWWRPPGVSPARHLDVLGVLGPGLLAVHGVWLSQDDRRLLAARGSPLVLCPRSNLHVGGRLPDVPSLLADDVALCLGTDSPASCPDLDVLGDLAVLARAWPQVPMEGWLGMATASGARAVGSADHGRIAVGARPGLVLLEVDDPRALADPGVPRRWVTEG